MASRAAWTGVFLKQHCLRYNLNLRGSITADRCCRSPRPWVPRYNPTTPLVGYEITKDGVKRVLIMQKALTFTWKTWILAVPHVTCVRSVKQLLLT